MSRIQMPKVDLGELLPKLRSQFVGLNPNDPSQWPAFPRSLMFIGVGIAVVVVAWYAWLSSFSDELDAQRANEVQLREVYKTKLAQAINLEELKKQLDQVKQYVNQLEKQLPSKAEMDALLSDINQAGLGRSLQFELFRPGQVVVKEYYAELPISIKVTGSYHDIGQFASDVAHLSRIVTLNDIGLLPLKDKAGMLTMDGTAKTFRYLDTEEIAAQKKAIESKVGSK
jgi:type IV pilus assembly protein PilO